MGLVRHIVLPFERSQERKHTGEREARETHTRGKERAGDRESSRAREQQSEIAGKFLFCKFLSTRFQAQIFKLT